MENNRYREEEKEEQAKENVEEIEEVQTKEETNDTELKSEHHESKNKKKINHLKEKISSLEQELADVKNEMLKDRAELENFKKRTNQERINDRKYANQQLVSDLVDIIDIFDKEVSREQNDEKLQKFLIGFSMINQQIQEIMKNHGLTKIEALGKPFNPAQHETIGEVEAEGAQANTVVEVVRNGYMFKDRVIRPSMVKIAK